MTAAGQRITAEELLCMPDDAMRHEIVRGELRTMAPSSSEHAWVALAVGSLLRQYVRTRGLGRAYGAGPGFLLARNPDLLRAPDAAFVRQERVTALHPKHGYFPGPPDLAIEVVSPNDTAREVEEKVADWLAYGTRMVVVIDPEARTARVYQPGRPTRHLGIEDSIDGADVVPDWVAPMAELFA